MLTRQTTHISTYNEEENQVTYYLGNMTIKKGNCIFTDFQSMDAKRKRIINLSRATHIQGLADEHPSTNLLMNIQVKYRYCRVYTNC